MIEHRQYGPVRVLLTAIHSHGAQRRAAEKAAVGKLLREAFPEGFELRHNADGAPVLAGKDVHISISHSLTRAAVALCAESPVGIDIETMRPQLRRVAPRVLSEKEMAAYGASLEGCLQAWTLKEALYKAALTPGLDFRRDIHLPLGYKKNEATVATPSGAAMRFIILAAEIAGGEGLALAARDFRQSLVP